MEDALALDGESINGFLKRVLILVVMEDALALTTMSTKKLTALLVLILVVMEDALAPIPTADSSSLSVS